MDEREQNKGGIKKDLGEAAALRDHRGLWGHEAPAAEERVGVPGATAGAAVVVPAAATVHRGG